jgi:hypothetical protein
MAKDRLIIKNSQKEDGGGGGGVPEAPIDNIVYGRRNANWVNINDFVQVDYTQDFILSDSSQLNNLNKLPRTNRIHIRGNPGGEVILTGIANCQDGQLITIVNRTGRNILIVPNSGDSLQPNRFHNASTNVRTINGSTFRLGDQRSVSYVYSTFGGTSGRLIQCSTPELPVTETISLIDTLEVVDSATGLSYTWNTNTSGVFQYLNGIGKSTIVIRLFGLTAPSGATGRPVITFSDGRTVINSIYTSISTINRFLNSNLSDPENICTTMRLVSSNTRVEVAFVRKFSGSTPVFTFTNGTVEIMFDRFL